MGVICVGAVRAFAAVWHPNRVPSCLTKFIVILLPIFFDGFGFSIESRWRVIGFYVGAVCLKMSGFIVDVIVPVIYRGRWTILFIDLFLTIFAGYVGAIVVPPSFMSLNY
jgi:hypothetical protein|tara:strand:+ start:248 stop:577 length:330 start_codon:yes stop_codon:yes gene_type:complete